MADVEQYDTFSVVSEREEMESKEQRETVTEEGEKVLLSLSSPFSSLFSSSLSLISLSLLTQKIFEFQNSPADTEGLPQQTTTANSVASHQRSEAEDVVKKEESLYEERATAEDAYAENTWETQQGQHLTAFEEAPAQLHPSAEDDDLQEDEKAPAFADDDDLQEDEEVADDDSLHEDEEAAPAQRQPRRQSQHFADDDDLQDDYSDYDDDSTAAYDDDANDSDGLLQAAMGSGGRLTVDEEQRVKATAFRPSAQQERMRRANIENHLRRCAAELSQLELEMLAHEAAEHEAQAQVERLQARVAVLDADMDALMAGTSVADEKLKLRVRTLQQEQDVTLEQAEEAQGQHRHVRAQLAAARAKMNDARLSMSKMSQLKLVRPLHSQFLDRETARGLSNAVKAVVSYLF
jgi:hypothetical protein